MENAPADQTPPASRPGPCVRLSPRLTARGLPPTARTRRALPRLNCAPLFRWSVGGAHNMDNSDYGFRSVQQAFHIIASNTKVTASAVHEVNRTLAWFGPFMIIAGLIVATATQEKPAEQLFDDCRARWISTFRPDMDRVVTLSSAEREFARSCMSARGLKPVPAKNCTPVSSLTYSDCWQIQRFWHSWL